MKRYFQLTTENRVASLDIYGDITSWPLLESDVSAANLSRQLAELTDVDQIDVHINSYGGEVAEGLAIYNALRNHPAKVVTVVDGFACSIASVIFMAGDERRMNDASLLMIHNAWTLAAGNADDLRKQAEDLDVINDASVKIYVAATGKSDDEIRELMDGETWISSEDALNMGFATVVDFNHAVSNDARQAVVRRVFTAAPKSEPKNPEPDNDPEQHTDRQNTAQRWAAFFDKMKEVR